MALDGSSRRLMNAAGLRLELEQSRNDIAFACAHVDIRYLDVPLRVDGYSVTATITARLEADDDALVIGAAMPHGYVRIDGDSHQAVTVYATVTALMMAQSETFRRCRDELLLRQLLLIQAERADDS